MADNDNLSKALAGVKSGLIKGFQWAKDKAEAYQEEQRQKRRLALVATVARLREQYDRAPPFVREFLSAPPAKADELPDAELQVWERKAVAENAAFNKAFKFQQVLDELRKPNAVLHAEQPALMNGKRIGTWQFVVMFNHSKATPQHREAFLALALLHNLDFLDEASYASLVGGLARSFGKMDYTVYTTGNYTEDENAAGWSMIAGWKERTLNLADITGANAMQWARHMTAEALKTHPQDSLLLKICDMVGLERPKA